MKKYEKLNLIIIIMCLVGEFKFDDTLVLDDDYYIVDIYRRF